MKTAFKKLFCLMLVAMLLVSAVPAAFAAESILWLEVEGEGVNLSGKHVPVTVGETYSAAQCFAFAKDLWPELADYEVDADKTGSITIKAEGTNGIDIYVNEKEEEEPEEEPEATMVRFYIELWIDNEHKKSDFVDVPMGTDMDEAAIKAYAQQYLYGEYFGDGYKYAGVKDAKVADANNLGARIFFETVEKKPEQGNNNQGNNNQGNNNQGNNNQGNNNQGNNNQGWPNFGGNNNQGWPNFGGNNNQGWPNFGGNTNFPGFGDKDHNRFPGNGHMHPNFMWETVELTVVYNFPDNFRHMGRTSETFKVWKGSDILDALAAAENMGYYDVPTRDGYTLAGYSFDKACKNDVNRDDEINGDLTIYCEWERSKVTLRVYTNSDSRYPDRTFSLDSYARDGKITRTEVENLLDTKYTAKKGYSLAYYGLFTEHTWDHGDYDKDDAVSTINVKPFGETVIYVMVKNVKQSTADSTNPKTGDNIMIAVTTMTLAAVAVVSMVELKKRKMI